MIERIVVAILTRLGAWLYARALSVINERIKESADKAAAEAEIEAKTKRINRAYSEAFNGEPVSKEQREKLNREIADFLRGDGNGGL